MIAVKLKICRKQRVDDDDVNQQSLTSPSKAEVHS